MGTAANSEHPDEMLQSVVYCRCGKKKNHHRLIYIYIYIHHTVKPMLSGHSKRRPKFVCKTAYCFMQVKSVAE